jgi:sensor histidine kinase YesM
MKHAFPLKIEILLMVILMPPTLIVLNYLMLGEMYFSSLKNFGIATSVTLAILSCVWVVQAAIGKRMIELFPSHHDTLKRVMIFTTINLLIIGLFVTFTCWFYDVFNILNFEFNRSRWIWCLVGGAISCVINQAVYETVASYERIKASQLEAEQLKKAQLQTQFESLKEQVNPHFLFNSLNSLSSLIATNPDMAEEFVEEMSRVYRYLLRSNEEQLTTLRKELEFIESYNLLLKTRFGSGGEQDRGKNERLPAATHDAAVADRKCSKAQYC